jgi:glycosyltransferase involved in cell wall biosynthesis
LAAKVKAKVAIVIETVNALHYGSNLLHQTLNAISAQAPVGCEIIVVDVGLPQNVKMELIKRFQNTRFVDAPGAGYFQAKNIGYAAASAGIVAFPDSDCIPSANWVSNITEPLKHGAHAAAGLSLYSGGFLAKVMNVTDWGFFPETSSRFTTFFAANNIAIRKPSRFLFDTRFWRTGGDTIMALEMDQARIPVQFVPSARIRHYFPYRALDFIEMRFQEGFHVIKTRQMEPKLRAGKLLRLMAFAPILYYVGRLALDAQAIRRHRKTLTIRFYQAPIIFLFAAAYRLLDLVAMMMTLAAPRWFRNRYDW